ncbi:phosphatidylinositol 4,5-bisphosphate-binding protein [Coniosporium tulheliwenetii]|uniref:Phosphatidylinositol 4,5-bisphosphate-binding protein n=1 Tax=Coniosporium tulheliwenetii TaxID=3383036 RepID=A0ACC2ZHK8_9PEZI|nr:phosphatidylinositol 4,5-bisphosphate-binding protein [Cladosporium sp. JES 115]
MAARPRTPAQGADGSVPAPNADHMNRGYGGMDAQDFGGGTGAPVESSPLSQSVQQPGTGTLDDMEQRPTSKGSTAPSTTLASEGPSRHNTLKKKNSVKRQSSLKRSGSKKSLRSAKSVTIDPDALDPGFNNVFHTPVPTHGTPTDILANRFQAWRKLLKDIITYFGEVQASYEHRSKALVKVSNTINNLNAPSLFITDGGLNDANRILRDYHKHTVIEAAKARDIEHDVITQLTGLRADLAQKIKEIKSLSGDFKNSVDKEKEGTRKAVAAYLEAVDFMDSDPHGAVGKVDPYIVRLSVERQIERQIDEENYLHRAYLNLETSGRELESIIVGEIQKAYNALATILKREADDSYEAVEQLRSGPIAMPRDREWNQFVEHDPHFVNPKLPLRKVHEIEYPGKNHPAATEVRAGMLERKSKYLKSYTPGWYVLSPTHLHEFKSADRIYTQPPVMSLFLPDQRLGSHSEPGSTSHKFSLKGRQAGGMHRGHSWVFRAESHDTMLAWFNDIKALTEKTGEERNAFVRRSHARSVSGNSAKSVSSGSGIDEDEEDEAPYSAPPAIKVSTPEPPPQRPQPGGRFPSDLQINRHLQAPPSASSEGSEPGNGNDDVSTTAGGLRGAALPTGSTREHQAVQREPSQRSLSRDDHSDEARDEGNPAHNTFVALPEPSRETQREAPSELPTSATPAAATTQREPTPSYFHRHDAPSQAAPSKPPDQERAVRRDDTHPSQAPESRGVYTAPIASDYPTETYPTQQYQSQEYPTQAPNQEPAQPQSFLGETQPEITGQAGPQSQPSPVRQNSNYGDWMTPAAAGVGGVAAGAVGAEVYRRHQAAVEGPERVSEEQEMRPQEYQQERTKEPELGRAFDHTPPVAPLYTREQQTTRSENLQQQVDEPKEEDSPVQTPPVAPPYIRQQQRDQPESVQEQVVEPKGEDSPTHTPLVAPLYMRQQQKDQQEDPHEREVMSEERPLSTDTPSAAPLAVGQQYRDLTPVNPASLDISSAGFTPVGSSDVDARQQEAESYESPPTDAMMSTAGGLAMVQQKHDEPSFEPATGSSTPPVTAPSVEPQHQDDEIPPERTSPGGVAEPLLPPVDADPEEQHQDPPYPTSGVMATEMPTGPMQVPFSPPEPSPAEPFVLDSVYSAPNDSFVPPPSFMQAPYSPAAASSTESPVPVSSQRSLPSDSFVPPPSFMQAPWSPAEPTSVEPAVTHSSERSLPSDSFVVPPDSSYEQSRALSDDPSPPQSPVPAVYDEPSAVEDELIPDQEPLSSSTTAFLGTISSPNRSFANGRTGGPTQMRETGRIFPAVLRHNTDVSVSQLHIPGEYPKTPTNEFKGY